MGCSSAKIDESEKKIRTEKIDEFYSEWKGTKYRYGGTTKKGVDCSGLVQAFYRDKYNLSLPRSSKEMAKEGERISRKNIQIGDLILFKTGWRTSHVGIYTGNNKFLHTSTKKGVIISNIDSYWDSKYWKSRKIL